MIRVFLAGEGPNDIGDWQRHRSYREEPPRPGVIEVLLRKVRAEGWEVSDGVAWQGIRKYRARPPIPAEAQNVLGAALKAKESGCHVLAFTRDRDGVKFKQRELDVEQGIVQVPQQIADCPKIAGGMAIEKLESWLVALSGTKGSEKMRQSHIEERLAELGVKEKNTADMVRLAAEADLERLPQDASSLRRWLDRAREALPDSGG